MVSNKRNLYWLVRFSLLAAVLAWLVVGLGAYTRLTDAGLGCPDWPGCYGHWVVSGAQVVSHHKAWTEMVHRYFAGTLVLFTMIIALLLVLNAVREGISFLVWALLLFMLVLYQALLGMWTVTLKLWPVIVSQHLLGGITLLACLWWVHLKSRSAWQQQIGDVESAWQSRFVLLGLLLLYLQIALGAWTSTNYAALSCQGFPFCDAVKSWQMDFHHAFNLITPLGVDYSGGVLSDAARQTIQMTHRCGALLVTLYFLILAWYLLTRVTLSMAQRRAVFFMVAMLIVQISLGISNVLFQLPLTIAVLHNLAAALLLMSVLTVYHGLRLRQTRRIYG